MANNAKSIFQFYVKQGMTDREAMFRMVDHMSELHWKNDAHLRGEIDMLKKRLKALEGGKIET